MSLFDKLGQRQHPAAGGTITPQTAMAQLMGNPSAVLAQAGFNVPGNITDPRQIVNHLMQSGQVTAGRMQAVQRMIQMMGMR